jgi:hypothetical protein
MEGYSQLARIRKGVKFWDAHVELSGRVIALFHEELTMRFDESYLGTPTILIDRYNTKSSPLMRSSTLETFMRGMAAMCGRELKSVHWLELYEQSRQMLDDLADLWEDLLMGRLNYPVLVALKNYGPNSKLGALIKSLWNSRKQDPSKDELTPYWKTIKDLLSDAGAFQETCTLIDGWLKQVESSIGAELFSGNIGGLMTVVDLKKAYLARLSKLNFDNVKPTFQFYS